MLAMFQYAYGQQQFATLKALGLAGEKTIAHFLKVRIQVMIISPELNIRQRDGIYDQNKTCQTWCFCFFSTDVGSVLFPALTKDINAGEIQELRPQSKLPN